MLTKRSWFVTLSLLVVSLMLLAACAPAAEEAAPAEEEMAEEEEAAPAEEEEMAEEEEAAPAEGECAIEDDDGVITIANATHLSGWMSAYDAGPRRGAMTAVRLLQEQGGIGGCPVEYIELDGQTDVAVLGNIALQLVDQGADVMLTPCDFDFAAAAGQVAQEAGIVAMSTCASSPLYGSTTLGDMNFTMSYWTTEMGAGEAEYAYNDLGFRNAYFLTTRNTEYTASLGDYSAQAFEELGGNVLAHDDFDQDNPDISAQVQRIKELEPEVIFLSSNMPGLGAAVRQIRGAGIDTPMFGGDSWDTEEFWVAVGPEMANDFYIATFSWVYDDTVDPNMRDFIVEFAKDWGKPPELAYDTMGYDSVNIVAQAIEAAGTTEGAAVSDALEAIEFEGLSGKHTFMPAEAGADGHRPINDVWLIKVTAGKPEFLKKFTPSVTPEV